MRSVVLSEFGATLEVRDVPAAEPAEGEVRMPASPAHTRRPQNV